jgi:hypothetical protein
MSHDIMVSSKITTIATDQRTGRVVRNCRSPQGSRVESCDAAPLPPVIKHRVVHRGDQAGLPLLTNILRKHHGGNP